MKRFKIKFPALNTTLILIMPQISKVRKIVALGNLIDWLYLISIPLFLTTFVFYKSLGSWTETSVFNYLIVSLGIIIFFYLSKIIIFESKELIDPPFLLMVLLFAVATTISSLFISTATPSNSFGLSEIRLISGVSVMVFFSIFYLVRAYLKNTFRLSVLFNGLFIGFIIYILFALINFNGLNYKYEVPAILILFTFFSIYVLNSARLKFWKLVISGSVFLILFQQMLTIADVTILGDSIFALLISSVILSLLLFVKYKDRYINALKTTWGLTLDSYITKDLTKIRSILKSAYFTLALFSPIILFWVLIWVMLSRNYSLGSIQSDIQSIVNSFNYLVANSNRYGFINLLVGGGFREVIPSMPLFANIIRVQGILGIIAYAGITIFSLIKFVNLIKSTHKDSALVISLGFILLAIPISALFLYPTLFLAIFWWIALAILSYFYKPNLVKERTIPKGKDISSKHFALFRILYNLLLKGGFDNKVSLYRKLIGILFLAVAIIFIVTGFLNVTVGY